jgi:hypothetical protein
MTLVAAGFVWSDTFSICLHAIGREAIEEQAAVAAHRAQRVKMTLFRRVGPPWEKQPERHGEPATQFP